MAAKRDTEELREFLKTHSVQGYQVNAPIFGPAMIERQISTGGGFVFYRVIADKPVPFRKFAEELNVSSESMTLKEWEDKFIAGKTKSLPPMAVDLMEQLEAGGSVSHQDVLFRELMDVGCMDEDQGVFCYTFDSRQLPLRALKKGMAVELGDHQGVGWPGRIVGIDGKTVLVEQFAPVTFMRTPDSIDLDKIKPGFYSKNVVALGYGVMDGFELQGVTPPPGEWTEDKQEYMLREPMPLSEIQKFCKKHYPLVDLCAKQAMTFFILPIASGDVQFFPLPEGQDPELFLVEYEGN